MCGVASHGGAVEKHVSLLYRSRWLNFHGVAASIHTVDKIDYIIVRFQFVLSRLDLHGALLETCVSIKLFMGPWPPTPLQVHHVFGTVTHTSKHEFAFQNLFTLNAYEFYLFKFFLKHDVHGHTRSETVTTRDQP